MKKRRAGPRARSLPGVAGHSNLYKACHEACTVSSVFNQTTRSPLSDRQPFSVRLLPVCDASPRAVTQSAYSIIYT